ncbi:nicotinamide mononucleotide deamidase-related protein [Thermoplasma volcanium]|uniref:Protein TV0584 n=1 Tax=Thermoplasma volcanium (strain ATCC 51530 / DSM 4299 / JCM 9571 / NBRC 15438 / GSS1) TaxID=273116 RepID=Y584_THEVO|nr:nicotinamide mononucleotide deamidase-related protein [Thermoplasma volcanium]Q97B73.2 RecName: Full=Protein TV0584 [Thermoplasma volcanium GSS1]
MKDAVVITVGNEVLKGRTVNTNASFIGNFLTYQGYRVKLGLTVMDDLEDISWAFKTAMDRGDVIVSSGGLGPTFDDMTVEGFAKAIGSDNKLNQDALAMIEEKYKNIEITPERKKMAMMPEVCKPIRNPVGTAPGLLCSVGGKKVVILPGVPMEMQALLESMRDSLAIENSCYFDESINITGIMESTFAPYVERVMREVDGVYVKSHPKNIEVVNPSLEIEVSAYDVSQEAARKKVKDAIARIRAYAETILDSKDK